ncbi:MAG: 2OG-Fe(II) oxygenase [Planctomycetota bacterium]
MTNENPKRDTDFIGIFDNALDQKTCVELVRRFESFPQVHSQGKTGSGVDKAKKDSVDCCISEYQEWTDLNQILINVTLQHLIQYVNDHRFLVCGALAPTIRLETGEIIEVSPDTFDQIPPDQLKQVILSLYRPGFLNLQKYLRGSGGYHHWHSEIYPRESDCETLHRVLLFMFFLNTVEEGGETEFYYQSQKVSPKQGRMVIAPAGFTHTHKGAVPISHDKYIVTSWIQFQRAEQIYGQRS